MKFKYRRTGGIANIKIEHEFDSESLPPEMRMVLNKLLKVKSTASPSHPDEFIHELVGSKRKIRFLDSKLTPDAMVLFEFLTQRRKGAK